MKELPIIIKADVQGSAEVLADTLTKLTDEKVKIRIIHSGVGAINESDVLLASASNAIIIGFNVRPDRNAADVADREKVDIRLHSVIYNVTDEMKKAMTGLLEPTFKEVRIGAAEVREIFKVPKFGTIAGCMVTEGRITRVGRRAGAPAARQRRRLRRQDRLAAPLQGRLSRGEDRLRVRHRLREVQRHQGRRRHRSLRRWSRSRPPRSLPADGRRPAVDRVSPAGGAISEGQADGAAERQGIACGTSTSRCRVEHQDLWQRAGIAVVTVRPTKPLARRHSNACWTISSATSLASITRSEIEFLPDMSRTIRARRADSRGSQRRCSAREVHDPGIGFVTLTRVQVTADLQQARVYYTTLGDAAAGRRPRGRSSGRCRSCAGRSASGCACGACPSSSSSSTSRSRTRIGSRNCSRRSSARPSAAATPPTAAAADGTTPGDRRR